MNQEDFQSAYVQAQRERPNIFRFMQAAPPASEEELSRVEEFMGCSLESSHREFLKIYGGGEFGLGLIFCANRDSEWYIPSILARQDVPIDLFFPVSDNFVGDLYGFAIEGGRCVGNLKIFDHESSSLIETDFSDVFEFMERYALRPA